MLDLNPHQFSNNQPDHRKSNSHNYYFNHYANNNYYRSFNNNDNFRLETRDEEEEEVSSPPLWRNNYISPVVDDPRALSPASRAQAIARGQRELMEMVENMPETSYELSLKDMVDHHHQQREFNQESTSMEDDQERSILRRGGDNNSQTDDSQRWNNKKKGSVKRQESGGSNKTGRIIVKNGSINRNEGLLINMFFPFSTSFGTKKRKSTNSVKFSLKPDELFMEKPSGGRDWWWWKKYKGGSSSGDSESLGITSSSVGESTGRSGSSGSSGSSGGGSLRSNSDRNKNGCKYGCWSFFPSRKKKLITSSPGHEAF